MSNNIVFDSSLTLKLIDWDNLISKIRQYSHFDITKDKLTQPPENFSKEKIRTSLSDYEHFESFYLEFDLSISELFHFISSDFNFSKHIKYLTKSGVLELSQLNQLALIIEFSKKFRTYIREINPDFDLKVFYNFITDFRKFVSENGDVDLMRHPLVKQVYAELLNLESSLRKEINSILKDPNISNKLQYSNFDILNDRYVIPLRSDSYSAKIGQIISRSDTGQTLYVEPFELREMSNHRLELLNKIDELTHQICNKYCEDLKSNADLLYYILDIVHKVDYQHSLFMFYRKGKFCIPQIADTPHIELHSFYHPLIEDPITNNIDIDKDLTGLVISGPNMGGKTATLKSVAISYLFFMKGFKVPAQSAKLYPYQQFYYFGHDDQNLTQGQSSFSSEVNNYSKMLNSLSKDNLIILDEIFNSTSSEEASALAISIFNYISKNSSSHIFVSTHHQMLKTFLYENKNFLSCHVGFLEKENKPNYKLYFDGPGSSHALEIFTRITSNENFSKDIISSAENILDKKFVNYEKLLRDLSYKNGLLEQKLSEIESTRKELANQKKSQEGILKLRMDQELEQYRKQMDKIINDAYKIKSAESPIKNRIKKLEDSKSKHFNADESRPSIFSESQIENNFLKIEEGKFYYCTSLKAEVLVKKYDERKKIATVSRKNMTIKVPIANLRKASSDKNKKPVNIHFEKSQRNESRLEYDCRGMRANEFESFLSKVASDLYRGEAPFVEVIHGHGEGALKKVLKEFLINNKDLAIDDKEDGNDGSTRLVLRN